jgi:hypothetical protein
MGPRAELLSRVACLYVVDAGPVTDDARSSFRIGPQHDKGSRVVKYGRYHDTMGGGGTEVKLLAVAHVDSDRLRTAERHLEAFLRCRGACLEHPHAVLAPEDVVLLQDCMTIIGTKYCGKQEESIAQLERRDADHAREARALKNKLRLRDEEIRLKDYELQLKGYENGMLFDEAKALRARCARLENLLPEEACM